MEKQLIIGPASKKQEDFINSPADVVVFGGGAGSGKSHLGIMDMLKYSNDPKFRGVIVRRLTPQIYGPGGVWESAINLYRQVYSNKIKVKKQAGVLEFPSGAQVHFRHCQYEDDRLNFQGKSLARLRSNS